MLSESSSENKTKATYPHALGRSHPLDPVFFFFCRPCQVISLQMRVTRCGSLPSESPSDTPSHIWFWGVDASGSHGTGNAARPVPAAGVVVHEKTCGLMTRLLKREGMQLQVNDGVRQ